MLLLSNRDVQRVIDMAASIEALERAFGDEAAGGCISTPTVSLVSETSLAAAAAQHGADPGAYTAEISRREPTVGSGASLTYTLNSVAAVLPGAGVAAVRITSDVADYPVVNGRRQRVALPVKTGFLYCGLLLIFSSATGDPLALMPEGLIQSVRVAATGAVGIKHLARQDVGTLGVLGAGVLAEQGVIAAAQVRAVERVLVFSPRPESREGFARRVGEKIGVAVQAVAEPREVVEAADVLVTATSAREPVMRGEWLRAGTHVCQVNLKELGADSYARADVTVLTWRDEGGRVYQEHVVPRSAERVVTVNTQLMVGPEVTTVGEVIAGSRPGRSDARQITLHVNNSTGLQFAAVGAQVLEAARAHGLGIEVEPDYVLQPYH